jgi:hypothetical protein
LLGFGEAREGGKGQQRQEYCRVVQGRAATE